MALRRSKSGRGTLGRSFTTMDASCCRTARRMMRVLSANIFCQAAHATIRAVKAEIGKQWGSRRALWKMPPRVERALLRKGRRDLSPDIARSGCGAECAEEIG